MKTLILTNFEGKKKVSRLVLYHQVLQQQLQQQQYQQLIS